MKRYNRFTILMLIVMLMTGCVKQKVDMTITDNNKMKIEVTSAMASSVANYSEEYTQIASRETLKKLGFTVKDYEAAEGEDMVGIVFSKTYNLKKISNSKAVEVHLEQIGSEGFDESQYFQVVKKGLLSTTYKATFVFDTSNSSADDTYADSYDISYSVTLPRKAISNNADTVNGKQYIWKVNYGDKKEINYEFKVINSTLIYGVVAIGIIIVVVLVTLLIRRKKNNGIAVQQIEIMQE